MKCYKALFNRNKPCENCKLGNEFFWADQKHENIITITYKVSSQTIEFDLYNKNLFVNIYNDVSEQQRIERIILESAKMAELGTIGSSIAHELNNPLGGMLSFIQLIRMDLKGDEHYHEDIIQM